MTLVAIARRLRMSKGAVTGFLHRRRGPRPVPPRQDDDEQPPAAPAPTAWVSEIPPPTLAQLMGEAMMRPIPWLGAEPYRMQRNDGYASRYGDPFGCFQIPYPRTGVVLTVIATDGDYKAAGLGEEYAWEHVSVSLRNRTPNWAEMDFICRIFWREDETVMQLHVPPSENISRHPNCLHMWRPIKTVVPRPPAGAVG